MLHCIQEKTMGNVYADITLKNSGDISNVGRGIISDKDVRTVTLSALVDTGASTLVINDKICRQLGLSIEETRIATLAGGVRKECKITEPVQIQWKERKVSCNALVMPEGNVLLGVIPLEFMDLMVDPVRHELTGAHGDQIVTLVM
jgi:clan AA aspartic protease